MPSLTTLPGSGGCLLIELLLPDKGRCWRFRVAFCLSSWHPLASIFADLSLFRFPLALGLFRFSDRLGFHRNSTELLLVDGATHYDA